MASLDVDQRVEEILEASRTLFRTSPGKLRAVILYGSALEPAFRADSDIDIAILDDTENRLSWRDQAEYMDRLEQALKRGVDLRMLRDGSPSYQVHVLDHGKLICERPAGSLAQYTRKAMPSLQATLQRALKEWPRAPSRLAGH